MFFYMRLINSSFEILFYTTHVEADDSAVEVELTEREQQVLEQHQAGYIISISSSRLN
jgi:hypothetical protein